MSRLQVLPPDGDRFVYPLEAESIVIGRSSECDLRVADRFLSRRHARLFQRQGRWEIEDLDSHNGTLVNGRRISTATPVDSGDEIQLSGTCIRFLADAEEDRWSTSERTLPEHSVLLPAVDLIERQRSLTPAERDSVEALQRHGERLRLLNEVHDALGRSVELPELLELILARAFEQLEPDEGVILLKRGDGGYDLAAHRSRAGSGAGYIISETLVSEVVGKGQSALVHDVGSDERFAAAESIAASGMRSLIAAPLLDPEGALGLLALSSLLHRQQFGQEDLELLTSLASVAALRIRNLSLTEEAAQRRRLEAELRLARQIQVALLPDRLPQPAGYELHGMNVPSRGVSGDFYEAIERAEGRECVLLVADVSGKGVGAALLTASLEALLIGPIEAGHPPEEICRRVNQRMFQRTPSAKYATAFLAVLDTASGLLRYACAGHNPALLVRSSGAAELLETRGTPLGLLQATAFGGAQCRLDAGDTLVIYTDGITEATNESEEEYGIDRLIGACQAMSGASLEDLMLHIERDLGAFVGNEPYADDRTVLATRRLSG